MRTRLALPTVALVVAATVPLGAVAAERAMLAEYFNANW